MNIAPFIYGRTKFEDHRFLAQPLDDFCTMDTFDWFKGFVRQVINTDHFGDIEIPRWSLAKKDGYLLWGCGIYLKMINNEFAFDVGARPVRCFIGFLARESEQIENIPYGNELLLSFFVKFIIPKWEETKNLPNKVKEFELPDFKGQYISKDASFLVKLNRNPNKLKLFPIDENNSVNLFAAALTLNNDISVVTGLNYKRHSQAAGFLNSTVFEVMEECFVDFSDNSKLSDPKPPSNHRAYSRNENADVASSNIDRKQKQSILNSFKETFISPFGGNSSSEADSNMEKSTPNLNHDYFGKQSSNKDESNHPIKSKPTMPFGFKYDACKEEVPVPVKSNIDQLIDTVNAKICQTGTLANQQFEKEIISILEDIMKILNQLPK